jgi:hypothetical protein
MPAILLRDAKAAPLGPPAENSWRSAIAGPGRLPPDRPLRRPWARSSPTNGWRLPRDRMRQDAAAAVHRRRPGGGLLQRHEANDILRDDLHPDGCP